MQELDLEAFDSESEVVFLNNALRDSTLEDLEGQLGSLLLSLEAARADTSFHVENLIQDVSRSVPRVSFDLQLMREHALLLRFALDSIRKPPAGSQIQALDPSTSAVLDKLATLDKIKGRMEAARDVLREAESWSTLDSEVSAYIQEQSFGKAADRLAEAAKSMVVFTNTPEFEARRALMISLQNSLEASLSASLVKAIAGHDVKACKSYFNLFGQIQREAEFRNYYYGSRRSALVQKWQEARLSDCSSPRLGQGSPRLQATGDGQPFASFLPSFYHDLLAVMEEERAYVPHIFPNPQATLSSFLQSTLDALIPSFHQRLSECADSKSSAFLMDLIEAYRSTESFAVRAEAILMQLAELPSEAASEVSPAASLHAHSPSLSHPTTPLSKERRMSKRYSVSIMARRSSGTLRPPSISGPTPPASANGSGYFPSHVGEQSSYRNGTPQPWEVALFEPFLDYQVQYASLESSFLISILDSGEGLTSWAKQIATESASQGVKALWEQFQRVLIGCEDALSRSVAVAHGYASAEYIRATDSTLAGFLRGQTRALDAQSLSKTLPKRPVSEGQLDLEGLDYSADDWAVFQLGLRLLGTGRQISTRLTAHEAKVRTRLTELASRITEASRDMTGDKVPGTTQGALLLLRQSTLQSFDLNNLFDQLLQNKKTVLYPSSSSALTDFAKAAQLLLHDTIIGPLKSSLAGYASLPVWSSSGDARSDLRSAFELNMPTFSLSPTEVMTRLGEGLFNLPRLFEVYADDDALAFSLQTLPFVDVASLVGPFGSPAHKRQSVYDADSLLSNHPLHAAKKEEAPVLSTEDIVSAWLTSLTTAVLTFLTSSVLPEFRTLSSHGASQLASDLSHISNVAKALDADTDELERWRECIEMSEAEGRKAVADPSLVDDVLRRVAAMRHWR